MSKIATIICGSFTAMMLFFVILFPYDMAPEINSKTVVQGFIICTTIGILMVAVEQIMIWLDVYTTISDTLAKILICYLVVFIEGGLFGMTQRSWHGFLEITPVLIPVFLTTYLIGYGTCLKCAVSINKHLKEKGDNQ